MTKKKDVWKIPYGADSRMALAFSAAFFLRGLDIIVLQGVDAVLPRVYLVGGLIALALNSWGKM